MAAILDFGSDNFSSFWSIVQVAPIFPSKSGVSLPSGDVQNRFSRWRPLRPSWISNLNDFSYFLSTSHPIASYQVSSQLVFRFRRRSKKNDFQDRCHGSLFGFPIGTIWAMFDLQVIPMLPTKFKVIWPFGSGEEAKNRFSRWLPWRPYWKPDWNDFNLFSSTSHPYASNQVSSQLAFQFRRRSEKKFSRWPPWQPFWFLIGTILAIFYLKVTSMLPTKFQIYWPFGSGEKAKNRFSRWLP